MTKNDLVKDIADKTGVEKIEVLRIVESLMDTVKSNMIKGKNIYLRSFGTFLVKKRAKKTARNISKKTTIIIPEHFAPAFKPAKEFAEKIKAKKH
jgi:DNA-binding protein HU-beta